MLQADKQVLLAGVKRNALELRQRELEFHVERYTNLATQASVIAGFSFESLVELEVPEGTHPVLSSFYFIFGSSAMALALYVLCVASFACVFGHRLALQGPHGSLEKAVHILIAHRVHIFATAGISLAFLVCAAVLMAWIKMGYAAAAVTAIFLVFAYAVFTRMRLMFDIFHIPEDNLVTGAFRVQDPSSGGVAIDLSHLNPSTATAQHHSMPHGGAYTRVQEVGSSQDGCRCPTNSMSASSVSSLLQTSPTTPRAFPGSPGAKAAAEAAVAIRREGHLFKRAERGLFSNSDRFSRRYFVLKVRLSHETLPHHASPHLKSPRLASPHLTSPQITSPRLVSPHLTSPQITSNHLKSPEGTGIFRLCAHPPIPLYSSTFVPSRDSPHRPYPPPASRLAPPSPRPGRATSSTACYLLLTTDY